MIENETAYAPVLALIGRPLLPVPSPRWCPVQVATGMVGTPNAAPTRIAAKLAAAYGWLVRKVAKSPCWSMIGRLPAASRKL